MIETLEDLATEQVDIEPLAGTQLRKQNELAQKAIDEMHSYLVAFD